MADRRFSATLPAFAGVLLLTAGLVGGCARSVSPTTATAGPEQKVYASGYPFRPAPFYNLDDLDELSGPEGYTAGY
ncbi:hypothetical protein SAMN06265365_10630 [Tistlia consotensis]|uniref:Uncharacterized protein n=1 Tax=Tistlia consotensis USBA 355 TaxID=560819 RepID=A0A1Y6BE40_9PROT|nr:hypothetical protein [Tistlia consotensis]SMF02774.1 hypothetical protein SAMN05428998_10381 [Tistlia consotensis USBA 355]SNR53058.1 hypothetical protein SAMN06265365_10630 [Tistlia consotensis]